MVPTLVGTKGLRHFSLMKCGRSIPPTLNTGPAAVAIGSPCLSSFLGFIACLLITLIAPPTFADGIVEAPTPLTQALLLLSSDRMLMDIRTLSGPQFNGRQTGTPDDLTSAEFVRRRFLDLQDRSGQV